MGKIIKKIRTHLKLFFERVILFKRRFFLAVKLQSITEKRIIFLFLAISFVLLGLLLRNIYLKNTKSVPATGGVYIEGEVGRPKAINPLIASSKSELDLSSLIFSPLLKRDENDNIIPSLAEGIESSADGKKYFLDLSSNVFWHDGEKFSGEDVIFTVSLIQDDKYSGFLKDAFKNVKTLVDGKKLTFELAEANVYFPSFLTSLYILPKHILSSENVASLDVSTFNNHPIGTGPFVFVSKKDSGTSFEEIDLERNKNYFGKSAFLDRFIFKFYESGEELNNALVEGKISGMADFQKNDFSAISKNYDFNLYRLHLPKYFALFFNLDKKELNISDTRYAFAESINKEELLQEIYLGEGQVVGSPLLPDFIKIEGTSPGPAFDQKDAAAIIKKLKLDNKKFILVYPSDDEVFSKAAEKIKSDLLASGILVEMQGATSDEIVRVVIPDRSFDLLLFGINYGYSLDEYPFWHSSQVGKGGLNISGYQDVKIDRILQAIRFSVNLSEREDLNLALSSKIGKDIPAVFLLSPYYNFALSGTIKGVQKERLARVPADRFSNVADWYIKTKRVLK